MRLFKVIVLLTSSILATSAMANEDIKTKFDKPSVESLYVANDGEVMLTFLSKEAAYSNDIYLAGTQGKILNNQTAAVNQQFSLGSFQAGTELIFSMFVNNTSYTFFNGKAENNLDKILHTAYEIRPDNLIIVGFEDLFNGGDRDYDDLVFSLSNVDVKKLVVTPVPEPETYAMLLAGLLMLGAVRRRKY